MNHSDSENSPALDLRRSVRKGDAHRLGLRPGDRLVTEEPIVDARSIKPFVAEARPCEYDATNFVQGLSVHLFGI